MKHSLTISAVALLLPAALFAQASTVVSGGFASPYAVSSYSMLNGNSGTWRYWDYTYSAGSNQYSDNAPLAGGTGLLTDGFGATTSWYAGPNPAGNVQGQFVGWSAFNPSITFFFSSLTNFTNVRVNYDLAYYGGVGAPGATTINGVSHATTLPGGSAPFWADYDISTLPSTSSIQMDFSRTDSWIMISEVQFQAVTAAPEPASVALVSTGLLGVFGFARRRRTS